MALKDLVSIKSGCHFKSLIFFEGNTNYTH